MAINLNNYIVKFEGKEYVPVEIASAAILEAIGAREDLESAFTSIKNSIDNIEIND